MLAYSRISLKPSDWLRGIYIVYRVEKCIMLTSRLAYNECPPITTYINSAYQELLKVVSRARGVAFPQHEAIHDIRPAIRSRSLFDSTANEVNRSCTLMLFRQRVTQHDC